ncbi:DUF7563 family protein [Halorussus marinus]|uniref:DUF7563 family protein n=1 Tax=Halorussus marinus TaxID=2505976 RepID=UPI001B2FF5B2|nr:hypothetical protein [Halorussus marinus]
MAVLHNPEAIQSDDQEAASGELADGSASDPDLDQCQFCAASVTERFRKVYGDNQDIAHRCLQCDTSTRLQKGSAAGHDVDHVDPQDEPWRIRNGHANRGGAF